jgi:hypothetical protein
MKRSGKFLASAVVLAAITTAQPATAQEGCADIDFAPAISSRFPNIAAGCLGLESREGRTFAHFQGEVVGTSGNTVRVRFRHSDGGFGPTHTLEMPADARVQIGGRSYRYSELNAGQELDVYLPPDLWEFHIPETENFAAAQSVTVVTPAPAQASTGSGAVLPRTASIMPLIGGLGGLLTAFGFGLTALRRRVG